MANRVVVDICGEEYTLIAEESAAYMQRVGSYVGGKMQEVLSGERVGRTDAAVLTAVNIADELFKAQTSAEQLRGQIKSYVDEAGKAQREVSEMKREVFRLQQKLDRLQRPAQKPAPKQDRHPSRPAPQPVSPPAPQPAPETLRQDAPHHENPDSPQPEEQLPNQQSLPLPPADQEA